SSRDSTELMLISIHSATNLMSLHQEIVTDAKIYRNETTDIPKLPLSFSANYFKFLLQNRNHLSGVRRNYTYASNFGPPSRIEVLQRFFGFWFGHHRLLH